MQVDADFLAGPGHDDRITGSPSRQQAVARQGDRVDARDLAHPLEHALVEVEEPAVLIAAVPRVHLEHEQVIGSEAERLQPQVHERLREQAGGDHEQERERHLRRDQRLAGQQPERRRHAGRRSLEDRGDAEPRGSQRRQDPAQDTDAETQPRREGDQPAIEPERDRDTVGVLVQQRQQRVPDDQREGNPGGAACAGEEHALGQQLADQPSARRAEREAHRHLRFTGRRTRDHQAGDVCAADQQDCRHDRHQEIQRSRVGVPQRVESPAAGRDVDPAQTAALAPVELRRQRLPYQGFCLNLDHGIVHARLEPSHDLESPVTKRAELVPAPIDGGEEGPDRQQQVDRIAWLDAEERRGRHPDDDNRSAVDVHRASEARRRIGAEETL